MIRKAEKADFPFIFPILKQIFDEMQMKSINQLPDSTFYDLMHLGYLSENYRYSYRRIWVNTDQNNQIRGMIDMYSYADQKIIDFVLKPAYPKVGLPTSTIIFSDQEAWPHEWYIDAIAVAPKYWGKGIASQLLDLAPQIANKNGYHLLSLNVDKENPRAQRLYLHKGFTTTKEMKIGNRIYDHMIKKV